MRYGTELTSHAMLGWQAERGAVWHYIAPGKPMQNSLAFANRSAMDHNHNRLWL